MVSLSLIFGVAAVWIVYWVCCVVYNVWFHPLAKFPGPWWAGASSLPEMYFDVVRGGRYFKQIEQMHERYGEYFLPLSPTPSSHCHALHTSTI